MPALCYRSRTLSILVTPTTRVLSSCRFAAAAGFIVSRPARWYWYWRAEEAPGLA